MLPGGRELERTVIDDPVAARAALADPTLEVPEPPARAPVGTLAWLRAGVSRFANGPLHAGRRALAEDEIAGLQPAALRAAARVATRARLADAAAAAGGGWPTGRADAPKWSGPPTLDAMALVARRVPVGVLGQALAVPGEAAIDAVITTAAAYHPGAGAQRVALADAAVRYLLDVIDAPSEVAAMRIGLLVQACDATAGLIGNALAAALGADEATGNHSVEALLLATLRRDAPVRSTRRRSPDGTGVVVDLARAGLPFGHGLRPCPGRDVALALAAGVVETVLGGYRLADADVVYEPSPNLRIPARLEVTAR